MKYAVQFKRKDGSTGLVLKEDGDAIDYHSTLEEAEAVAMEMAVNYSWTGLEYGAVYAKS